MKILYLEDNPQDVDLTLLALKRAAGEFKIDLVHLMEDALDKVRQNPPPEYDIVLTDLNVPDGSGLDLLAFIRSNELPYAVVVVTGDIEEETILAALKAGADDYVIKREDYLTRLPATLEAALELYRSQTARKSRPIHVLYAENNPADIEATTQHLQKYAAHIHITAVSTPNLFFNKLADESTRSYDVILLEYMFSGTTGLEILKTLHYDKNTFDIPVVFVTGQGNEDVLLQATRLGAADYVSKEAGYLFRLPGVIENAFHRAQMIREQTSLQRRLQELTVLHAIALETTQASSIDMIIEKVTEILGDTIYPDNFGILVYDKIQNALSLHSSYRGVSNLQRTEAISVTVGITGEAFRSRQPLRVENVLKHTNYVPFDPAIRSELAIPIITGDQVFGIINVESDRIGFFKEQDEKLLITVASQIGTAVNNALLYQETRQRLLELELVNRVSTSLRVAQTSQEIVATLLNETLTALNAEAGSIWLYDPAKQELSQSAAQGWFNNLTEHHRKPGEGFAGKVFADNEIFKAEDFSRELLISDNNRERVPAGWSMISLPIRTSTQPIGVLFISSPQRNILETANINLLKIIAEIAGNAIHRASLHFQTETQLQQLTALRDIDIAISSSFDLGITLDILLDHTVAQLHTDAASIMLYNPKTQRLELSAARGFHTITSTSKTGLRLGESFAGSIALKREALTIMNIPADPRSNADLVGEGFIFYFGIPLITKGQLQGVFEVFQRAPFAPTSEWIEFLNSMSGQAAIAIDNTQLFENLQRSNMDLALAYDTTLEGWGRALELRDRETEGHTLRVTEQTIQLALALGLSDIDMIHIRRGALLHDIGKMGIPDSILHKPGPLTDDEFTFMKKHPVFAYELLRPIEFLRPALDIPYCHHEKWDGSGYPRGLKGEEIPKSARIFALIDVWDALRSDRPYRNAWSKEKVIDYIQGLIGKQFDPAITKIFLQMIADGQIT